MRWCVVVVVAVVAVLGLPFCVATEHRAHLLWQLHTTLGDITVKFFSECRRTIENFVGHSRKGTYDGVLFHRVVRKTNPAANTLPPPCSVLMPCR